MQNPFEIKIQNQAEDERIIRIWRHHIITLIGPALRVIAFVMIPVALVLLTGLSMFSSPWLFGLFLLIVVVVITYAAYEWISWYGDVYILTNTRMIDIEQKGFFTRTFNEAQLDKIQDISYQISGFFQTFFDFGDVEVQTAGAIPNVDMNDIKDPQQQAVFMIQQQQEYLKERGDGKLSAEELLALLAKHKDHLDSIADLERDERMADTEEQLKRAKQARKKRQKDDQQKPDEPKSGEPTDGSEAPPEKQEADENRV